MAKQIIDNSREQALGGVTPPANSPSAQNPNSDYYLGQINKIQGYINENRANGTLSAPTPSINTTMSATDVGKVAPYSIPQTDIKPTTGSLAVNNNGVASEATTTATPPAPVTEKSKVQTSLDQLRASIAGQADQEAKLKEDAGLEQKRIRAQDLSNQLDQMDKDYRDQIKAIREESGGTVAGMQTKLAAANDIYQNSRANAALNYRIASQDYQGAESLVNDKVNALKEHNTQALQAWQLQANLVYNDLTESEKVELAATQRKLEREANAVADSYKTAVDNAVLNQAPPSVLAAIDKASREPNATPATIAAAAGKYGGDIIGEQLRKAQLQNLYSQINERNNQGTVSTINGKPQNAEQLKANGFADRLNESNIIVDDIGSKFTGSLDIGGSLPNIAQSADRQSYEQAKKNFVTAVLRRESGAVISTSEFKTEESKYFPQAGDFPATVAQKAAARNTAINNIYREANVLRPVLPGQIIESDGKKYKVSSDGETLDEIKK